MRSSALRVVSSRLAFPPTVVRARTSSSGELRASMKATASSVPGSVSMMYLVMVFPSPVDSRVRGNDGCLLRR